MKIHMQVKNSLWMRMIVMCICLGSYAQQNNDQTMYTLEQAQAFAESETVLQEWFKDMETPGITILDGEMIFSKEALKLIEDVAYRKSIYKKDSYTFTDVKSSLEKLELQKAFWQMIGLYPENKEAILQYIYAYDGVIPTDKVVTASFYTYAFFDPEITTIKNGKPEVLRPDIFEEYLRRTNEIVSYIKYFRTVSEEN
ncbi:hypothetical protein [Constantimarinum furrinae]|uniref:Uncharacterized protein n=1 Tax=Constantimarinum furrinae TaxID=2562285 RepID=A0A7G8PSH4_9FLAO|nr:hypothetical protein [Constantimarinum furrinae]QNJ97290.1 hypothetical protein ALE3EI_0713 [Constantimarinum furrinae]